MARRSPPVLIAVVLTLSVTSNAQADPPACSAPEIERILTDAVKDDLAPSISEGRKGDIDVEIRDAYETSRTDYTKQCAASIVVKDADIQSNPVNIIYSAILTEGGKYIARWENSRDDLNSVFTNFSFAKGLNDIRKQHPEMTEEQIRAEFYKPSKQ